MNVELLFCFHQVNKALTLDHTRSQWVDLGIHKQACMAQPETCGSAGGAISLWVKMVDCSTEPCGIISSWVSGSTATGSIMYLFSGRIQ